MIFRALLFLLVAPFALAACGGEEPLPDVADVENLRERPVSEQALYLTAFQIGEQIRQSDSTFNVDQFLRGFRAGFEADSATGVPYAVGYQQGLQLQFEARSDSSLSTELGVFAAGLREGFEGRERRLTPAEEQQIQEQMQMSQIRREAATNPQAQAYLDELDRSQARADSFLTANAARDSVQTMENGVQYVVLEEGAGESPEDGERVLVTYTGSLADGTVFDSSQGQPVDFEIGEGIIAGMREALKQMKLGSRWRLYIPPALGYGMQGMQGSPIGPNAVLVFDLTLVDVLDPVAEGTEAPALGQPQVAPGQ